MVINPLSREKLIFKAAIIFGFFGIPRYSTLGKLTYDWAVLISQDREEFPLETGAHEELDQPKAQHHSHHTLLGSGDTHSIRFKICTAILCNFWAVEL